jgi:hypothetical protein
VIIIALRKVASPHARNAPSEAVTTKAGHPETRADGYLAPL